VASPLHVGDQVVIGDGPLHGVVGQLLQFDPDADTAQVQVWITRLGAARRGVAVVTLGLLRAESDARVAAPRGSVQPRRGRPRTISDEQRAAMGSMYDSGRYSHAQIATALGVSKSSVTSFLRHRQDDSTSV
jgi:hypothetical protein